MRLMPRGVSKRWQNKWLFLSLNFLHSAPQTRPLQAQIKVLNYSCRIRRFINRMGSRCDGDRLWKIFLGGYSLYSNKKGQHCWVSMVRFVLAFRKQIIQYKLGTFACFLSFSLYPELYLVFRPLYYGHCLCKANGSFLL